MLRSGPFALARHRFADRDKAILAHPDHSLHAFRDLGSEPGPWTIEEDAQAGPRQAYRQALDRVESASDDWFFTATHCGAMLLEYHKLLKVSGSSTDYEVVKLHATTVDGHRLVTLRLRRGPEVKGRDREDFTIVFDADDLFVVRSIHFGEPLQDVGSDRRFEYDHPDGRPVLRSSVGTIPAQHRTLRLDVEECRFGPIPEAEFAPRTVSGQPRAGPARLAAGGRAIDRDAPRLVLAGVRRRRDQPGRWVRPGPGKPRPRPTGPAGRLSAFDFESVAREPGWREGGLRITREILAPTLPRASVGLRRSASPGHWGRRSGQERRSHAGAWQRDHPVSLRQTLEIRLYIHSQSGICHPESISSDPLGSTVRVRSVGTHEGDQVTARLGNCALTSRSLLQG